VTHAVTLQRYLAIETGQEHGHQRRPRRHIHDAGVRRCGPDRALGVGGLVLDFVPATFLPVFAMTLALTRVTRARRRKGAAPSIIRGTVRPVHAVARGALFAFAALVLLGGAGLAMLIAILPALPTLAEVIAFKLAYGAAIGLLETPVILTATMRDPVNIMPA
jgi:hypothetical protein